MGKEKLRFRDIWNRWYLWVSALAITFLRTSLASDARIEQSLKYYQSTGDEVALYCIQELPGLYAAYFPEELIGIFLGTLLTVFVLIMAVYFIVNKIRKTK